MPANALHVRVLRGSLLVICIKTFTTMGRTAIDKATKAANRIRGVQPVILSAIQMRPRAQMPTKAKPPEPLQDPPQPSQQASSGKRRAGVSDGGSGKKAVS
jgi:hypothetical protein